MTSVVIVGIGELAYVFENQPSGRTFGNFRDALLWAASAVFGQQGDPVPETVGGRVTMVVAFVLGLTLMASLAATLGAWLIDDRRERAVAETHDVD